MELSGEMNSKNYFVVISEASHAFSRFLYWIILGQNKLRLCDYGGWSYRGKEIKLKFKWKFKIK